MGDMLRLSLSIRGEKTDFFVALIVSTQLWIKNLHLAEIRKRREKFLSTFPS